MPTTKRRAQDLQVGDLTLSYGRLVTVKKGVVLLTLIFDSNAQIRTPPEHLLSVLDEPGLGSPALSG